MFCRLLARVALASILLLASLAPAGCNALERVDEESDKLLDELNRPGGAPSSGYSSSQAARKGSGFTVVKRPAMSELKVTDKHGNEVTIWGQAQSASTTPGHDTTMKAKALEMAHTGKYEYITIQRSWRTATGRVSKDRRIPDIIGVRHDGRVDAYEVKSKTDSEADLKQRLREGMRTLPAKHRGQTDVFDPQS